MSLAVVYENLIRSEFFDIGRQLQKTCRELYFIVNSKATLEYLLFLYSIPKSTSEYNSLDDENYGSPFVKLITVISKFYMFDSFLEVSKKSQLGISMFNFLYYLDSVPEESIYKLIDYNLNHEMFQTTTMVTNLLKYDNIKIAKMFSILLCESEWNIIPENLIVKSLNLEFIQTATDNGKTFNDKKNSSFKIYIDCVMQEKTELYDSIVRAMKVPNLSIEEMIGMLYNKSFAVNPTGYTRFIIYANAQLPDSTIVKDFTSNILDDNTNASILINNLPSSLVDSKKVALKALLSKNSGMFKSALVNIGNDINSFIDYAVDEEGIDMNKLLAFLPTTWRGSWMPIVYRFALRNDKEHFFRTFTLVGSNAFELLKYAHGKGTRDIVQANCEDFYV